MPTTRAAKLASIHDAEQAKLARRGVSATAAMGLATRAATIRAYRQGASADDLAQLIRRHMKAAAPVIADGMAAGYLQGVLRSHMTARPVLAAGVRMSTYDAVLDLLGRRAEFSVEQVQRLIDQYGTMAVTATGDASSVLEAKVTAAVTEAVQAGAHTGEGISAIRGAFDAAGVTVDKPYLLENLYRTEVSKTYNAGRWQANQAPEIQDILWGYEYVTVGDDRVREEHAQLDGTKLAKDDPRWRSIWPPNGYNCRCSTIEIFTEDVQVGEANVPTAADILKLDPAFRVNFGEVFQAA